MTNPLTKLRLRIIGFCLFFWLHPANATDTVFSGGPIKSLDLSKWQEGDLQHNTDQDGNPCLWSYQGFITAPERCRLRIALYKIGPKKSKEIFSTSPHILTSNEKAALIALGIPALTSSLEHTNPEMRRLGVKNILHNNYKDVLKAMVEMPDGNRRCLDETKYTSEAFLLSGQELEHISISGYFASEKTAAIMLDKVLKQAHW